MRMRREIFCSSKSECSRTVEDKTARMTRNNVEEEL